MTADRAQAHQKTALDVTCGKCRQPFTVDDFFDHDCPKKNDPEATD